MRHAVIVLLAVCCCAPFSTRSSALLFAQTADELVAKNIQARGGMEKMKAIKTMRHDRQVRRRRRLCCGREPGK